MKLSRDEEVFLRHWIREEWHYQDGAGAAKQLQLSHRAVPSDLAALVAAVIPDPAAQQPIALGPPPAEPPTSPWSEQTLQARLAEARALLTRSTPPATSTPAADDCGRR